MHKTVIGNPTTTPFNPNLLSNGSDDFIVEATEDDSGNITSETTLEEITKACNEGKQPVLYYKFKNESAKYKGCMVHFDDRENGQCCWIIHKYITSLLYAILVYCDSNNGWNRYTLSDVLNNHVSSSVNQQLMRKESLKNKVTEINALSDDEQYPSARAVYEATNRAFTSAFASYDTLTFNSGYNTNPVTVRVASPEYVDNVVGDIETALENIISKYGLGGDSV